MYAVVREADDRAWRSAYIHAVSHLSQTLRRSAAQNPMVLDTALALALTGWALAEPVTLAHAGRAVVLLAMTIAIAWLRTAPLAVLAVEVMGVALVTEHFQWPQGVAVLSAAYVATFFGEKRLVVGVLLVGLSAWLLAFGGTVRIQRGLVPLVLVAPVWLAGTAMRRREQRAAASAERADRLEREREAMLRAERARIARELHDVVTHSVSVMVLQTGAARQIMTKDEQRLRELLESVETSGRSALEELRRLLGLLSDEDREAPLAPQPGVTEMSVCGAVDIARNDRTRISAALVTSRPVRPMLSMTAARVSPLGRSSRACGRGRTPRSPLTVRTGTRDHHGHPRGDRAGGGGFPIRPGCVDSDRRRTPAAHRHSRARSSP